MTIWQAFFLGLVQGITEFLPVSSSGHLALFQHLFGIEKPGNYILFDLVCHLGTLLAILVVLFPLVKESLSPRSKKFWQTLLGTLPLFPLVFLLKPIKSLFDQAHLLGPCFLVTAALLWISFKWQSPLSSREKRWQDPLMIGLFQAVAILPGISRSGSTISAALLLGWKRENAIQFSFLLAIPAIVGGTMIEGWQTWQAYSTNTLLFNPSVLMIGFFTSCFFGYFSLKFFIRLFLRDWWGIFAIYCLILGLVTTYLFF